MSQDVSSDIVFTDETARCLMRTYRMLLELRSIVSSPEKTALIDKTLEELNELHDAITAQMEANEDA